MSTTSDHFEQAVTGEQDRLGDEPESFGSEEDQGGQEIVEPIGWTSVPQVNLVPAELLQERRFQRARVGLVALIAVSVLLVAGVTVRAEQQVDLAQADLTVAQAQLADVNAQKAQYAAVPTVVLLVEQATKARAAALGRDVLWSPFLDELDRARPAGVAAGAVRVSLAAADQPSAADPLSPVGLGSLQLTGSATEYPQVAAWLEALDEVSGLSGTRLARVARGGENGLEYTLSAVVTDQALSHRFDEENE